MKVGTVTCPQAFNYGAVLQAYALAEAIAKLGHQPMVVDYWNSQHVKRSSSLFQWRLNPRSILHDGMLLLHYAAWKRRYTRFAEFRKDYLPMSPERYLSGEELVARPPGCDVYVCGSDQIWNPSSNVDQVFFLRFAKQLGKKRIAYAPSFGVANVPPRRRDVCREYISDIDVLSAREQRGCEIIQELTGRPATAVVDPVLLLTAEEWRSRFAVEAQPGDYIFVYAMRTRRALNRLVEKLKAVTKLSVVLVVSENPTNRLGIPADRVIWDAGPKEFLGWLMGSRLVCTSSFHGTAFAAIMGKPFYSVQFSSEDSRMTHLLQCIGLQARAVVSEEFALPGNPLEGNPPAADAALAAMRGASLKYLSDALGCAESNTVQGGAPC